MNELVILGLGGLLAAFVNAAFATGGVYILMLTLTLIFPMTVAVPMISILSAGSLIGRIGFYWQHIDWRLTALVAAGGLIGVALGVRIFVTLNEAVITICLGLTMLVMLWMPLRALLARVRASFFYLGVVHSFIGTLLGIGGIVQSAILQSGLGKAAVTGTLAAMMLSFDVMKWAGFTATGFNFLDYLPHIVLGNLVGLIGSWLGQRVEHKVSEAVFRAVFKLIVSLFAVRLIWTGLAGLGG